MTAAPCPRPVWALVALTCLLTPLSAPRAAAAAAEGLRYRVTVNAGPVARENAPVVTKLEVGRAITAEELAALKGPILATLTPADGGAAKVHAQARAVAAEGERTAGVYVGWVLPALAEGQSTEYELTLTAGQGAAEAGAAAGGFQFVGGDGHRDLVYARTPVYRHLTAFDPQRRDETYKPFHHLYGFHDDGFITKGPGGQYTHHRGLYVGWNKTKVAGGKEYDFWHCPDGVAQRFTGYDQSGETTGPVFAREVSKTDWAAPDGKAVVRDTRAFMTWRPAEGQTLIDVTIRLENAAGAPITLGGDPQHAGFQFRAAEEVQSTKTKYVRPPSARSEGDDVWTDCAWVAGLFKIKGRPYAVVHMNGPQNPGPVVYSTRDYGRFGPFFTGELKPDEPITLRYRVLVLDADRHKDLSPEAFAHRYKDFTLPAEVSVERKR